MHHSNLIGVPTGRQGRRSGPSIAHQNYDNQRVPAQATTA
jgi:hypothetical protein